MQLKKRPKLATGAVAVRSALIVVLVTLVVAALSALPALWAAREAVLHDRAEQDWRAVNQQWLAITEPDLVDRWPVAIGISLPTIASAFRSIEGSTVTFETGALSGTVLTLGDVVLRPGVAGVDATARLTAERGRFLEVDIGVEGSLVVAGLAATRDDDGRRVVKVRIALVPDRVRLEGRRALAFFWLRGFWSSLAAVVVEHYASERLAFDASVPAEFSVEIPKGFDGRADIGAAEVGYHAAIPAIASSALLDYVYAIVGDRIWLLGRPVGEPPGAPGTPAIEAPPDGATRDQLIADSRTMREAINRSATLARSPTKVPQIDVILGKQLAALATADLLSGRTHTLTVRTTAVDGSLAEADTGKGTVLLPRMSAKLGMCASCGALEIGLAGRLAWDADGMRLALEPTAKAEATLAVTIDPGPGGGLPPRKLTLSGNGAAMISPTLSLGIIDPDRAPIAALDIRADCTPINFELAGAPADGPMVMPAAGARLELPLSLERMPPIVLLDTRPRFVALALPQLPTGIALRLAAAGVEVVATPRLAEIGDDRITRHVVGGHAGQVGRQ